MRWVHITELLDPTPGSRVASLLLTTGLQLQTAAKQRQFVRRLSTHHLAGLKFGTGFEHQQIPSAVLAEARRLEFPIFEVPREEMPFIAITEKAFGRLVNDQYETLQRGRHLVPTNGSSNWCSRNCIEEVTRALAAAIGGAVAALDRSGDTMAVREFRQALEGRARDRRRDPRSPQGRKAGDVCTRARKRIRTGPPCSRGGREARGTAGLAGRSA